MYLAARDNTCPITNFEISSKLKINYRQEINISTIKHCYDTTIELAIKWENLFSGNSYHQRKTGQMPFLPINGDCNLHFKNEYKMNSLPTSACHLLSTRARPSQCHAIHCGTGAVIWKWRKNMKCTRMSKKKIDAQLKYKKKWHKKL
jgi:hypothetical protein